MAVPGNFSEKQGYLTKISESDFVYLVRDILALQFNHQEAKIVDGPGDGKRDIYSIDTSHNECITQCKFHHDFNQTCGTRETDEIIIALNKFGYNSGYFCTSGKISPQSKREYLDNYPNFKLKWLEGVDIVDIVLSNNLLKKIWFDGDKIHLATTRVALPFIIRKLPDDLEIKVEEDSIELKNISIDCAVSEAINSFKQFSSFRDLGIRSQTYNSGSVNGYHLLLTGKTTFAEIVNAKDVLLTEFKRILPNVYKDSYYAIRFGIPYFVGPDEKDFYRRSITKLNLPIPCETFIINDDEIILESDWLTETDSNWDRPERIHMSQLSYFGFYNSKLNVIHFIYYDCLPEYENNLDAIRSSEVDKILWKKSLFIECKSGEMERFLDKVDDFLPHKLYDFGPAGKLACWLHPEPMMYSTDLNQFESALTHPDFETEKLKIRQLISLFDANEVDWLKASKVAAINNDDPFPSEQKSSFRIVDLYENFKSVPSPIQPNDRQIPFECVWYLAKNDEIFDIENETDALIERLKKATDNLNLDFNVDVDTSDETVYLIVYWQGDSKPFLSTSANVRELANTVTKIFDTVEKMVTETFVNAKRSTSKYWYKEFGVFLHKSGYEES